MARRPVIKTKAEIMAEKRAEMYETGREAFAKLKKGKALTEREARILQNLHRTFLELNEVFKPTIRETLRSQSELIENLLDEADEE